MSVGWYIVPYKRRDYSRRPVRYCAMDDYTTEIREHGGQWAETEVLGNRAVVKARAPQAVLNALDKLFRRIPKNRLDDSLADLPANVKSILRNELLDMGYTVAEIQARFGGDLGQYALRDLLKFMAQRRLKPRYDSETDEIILDGDTQPCRSIESVDAEVQG